MEKTDIFEGAGEMQILVTDKTKDTIMKLPVEVSKTEECSQLFKIDLKHKICLYAPEVNKNNMAKVIIFIYFAIVYYVPRRTMRVIA